MVGVYVTVHGFRFDGFSATILGTRHELEQFIQRRNFMLINANQKQKYRMLMLKTTTLEAKEVPLTSHLMFNFIDLIVDGRAHK